MARWNGRSMRRQTGHRRNPSSSHSKYAESTRSPQIEHTFPWMGWMRCRHSGHTGSREIFSRGKPQSRQSDGKKAENKLAAAQWAHPARWDQELRGTIEGLRTSTGTLPARIRSSLLLKTASSRPAARTRPPSELLCYCSIAVACTSRQRSVWRREPPLPSWV